MHSLQSPTFHLNSHSDISVHSLWSSGLAASSHRRPSGQATVRRCVPVPHIVEHGSHCPVDHSPLSVVIRLGEGPENEMPPLW